MRPFTVFTCVAAAALVMTGIPASGDEGVKFDPARMWECAQADGSSIYTNKERAGCTLMALRELSVVPSLEHMPTYRSPQAVTPPEIPYLGERERASAPMQAVPDWGQQWQASIAWSGGSTQIEVCSLYGEWINLVQKTRGGFFFSPERE